MAISVSASYHRFFQSTEGNYVRRAVLIITGLTADAANTVPHGLPGTPQNVSLIGYANGAFAEACSLDGTNGGTVTGGGASGFTATDIYLYAPAGVTTALAVVEY